MGDPKSPKPADDDKAETRARAKTSDDNAADENAHSSLTDDQLSEVSAGVSVRVIEGFSSE